MRLLSFLRIFGRSAPTPPTISDVTIQARIIRRLMHDGWIDTPIARSLGVEHPTNIFTRLRRMGLLYEADCAHGHVWVAAKTSRRLYKRHRWTGKVPAGWKLKDRRCQRRGDTQ